MTLQTFLELVILMELVVIGLLLVAWFVGWYLLTVAQGGADAVRQYNTLLNLNGRMI